MTIQEVIKIVTSRIGAARMPEIDIISQDFDYEEWTPVDATDDFPMVCIDAIQLYDSNHWDATLGVPKFENESDYPEWLERAIQWHMHKIKQPYKEFAVRQHIGSNHFDIYRCPKNVELVSNNPYRLEQWHIDGDCVILAIIEKTDNGITYKDSSNSALADHITSVGDLYQNPGNKEIHHLGVLFPTPSNAYVGKKVYYDPASPKEILVSIDQVWIWVDKKNILKKLPHSLADELLLINQIL